MKTEQQIREMIATIEKALDTEGINQYNCSKQTSLNQKVYIRRIAALDYLHDVLEDEGRIPEDELDY